jgi:hypothetical protein
MTNDEIIEQVLELLAEEMVANQDDPLVVALLSRLANRVRELADDPEE